ncbi:hypothetical protein AWENTII_010621 [Aspergillus wentii]
MGIQYMMPGLSSPIDNQADIQEFTIASFHLALRNQTTTCTEIITAYLARISEYNHTLKALITVNKNALDYARQKDAETTHLVQNDLPFPPLHAIPIILKDTYTTKDMPTTSGVKALKSLQTSTDAVVVSKLRAAGAIILAKANLHEFSLEGATISSLGGQTRNPYDLTRTPGGSSGGTAAALAANFGLLGCGGDTVNSLRSPASACSIVGFRPSKGVVSKEGVFPVSETQDVAGPMGRVVSDVRTLFDVMRDDDIKVPPSPSEIKGKHLRIGVLTSYFGDFNIPESAMINQTILNALQKVQTSSSSPSKSTLTLEFIHLPQSQTPTWDVPTLRSNLDTQSFEFRTVLDSFLQSPSIQYTPHTSLSSIAKSGDYHEAALTPVFHQTLTAEFTPSSPEYRARLQRIGELKASVAACFEENALDALVYPHQRQLVVEVGSMVQPGRNGILAALTGCPAICIPAGFSSPSESAPLGVPIGLELMGRPGGDDRLFDIAEMFESVIQGRRQPELQGRRSHVGPADIYFGTKL